MGLDVVELVMNVEQQYGFRIPDHEAREMRSVGDLHQYILDHATPRPDSVEAWNWLRDMIAGDFGVPIDRVTRDAWIVRDLRIN